MSSHASEQPTAIGPCPIDADAIRSLIPHAGRMCLLEAVIDWNDTRIHCRTDSHRAADHPLARNGEVSALHLIEYGAQAMAIHGGLTARAAGETGAAPGLLVSVRDVQLAVSRIDTIAAPLEVHAERLLASGGGWLYAFRIEAADQRLASGRVAVMPSVSANLPPP